MNLEPDERKARMAQAVREIVTRRERAPRSPRLERALKRLIWRYTWQQEEGQPGMTDRPEEERGAPVSGAGRK